MKETIMTNITLPHQDDVNLKKEAAEAGVSKRVLATQITQEWLQGKTLREKIKDLAFQISKLPDKDKYFDALEAMINNCITLTENTARQEAAVIFGKTCNNDNIIRKSKKEIMSSVSILRGIMDLPKIESIDQFAFTIVSGYRVK